MTLNIIIADDNPGDQYLLRQSILDLNPMHRISSVYHGAQLLELLLKKGQYANISDGLPDCIFLDLRMPVLDGFESLMELKANDILKEIPVFILSSYILTNEKINQICLKAAGFYYKTSDYDKLKINVAAILKKMQVQMQ